MQRHLLTATLCCGLASTLLSAAYADEAIVISTKPTNRMSCSGGICTPQAPNAVLNVTDLENFLATGNLTVSTGGATSLDIVFDTSLTWASANSLTLQAYRSIIVKHPISVAGSGGLSIYPNGSGQGGQLSFQLNGNIVFLSLTNALVINGATYKLEGDIAGMASDIAANASGNYALAASYNAKGDGIYKTAPIPTWFSGNFEGLGNSISHLKIDDHADEFVGLFALINGGHVSDLDIVDAKVIARNHVLEAGILAGGLTGNINTDAGARTASSTTYGGSISGVTTSGSVQVVTKSAGEAGGVVGAACNSGGSIISLVTNSQSSAAVGTTIGFAGGLVGYNCGAGTIQNSFATGQVSSGNGWAGGLAGFSNGTISNSYATGNAATGNQTGNTPPNSVGGLVGYNYNGTVEESYSTGTATAGSGAFAGGLVGYDYNGEGTFSANYWDVTTSGTTVGLGHPSGTNVGTGLTTSQLQSGLPGGFSPETWTETPAINSGLPYLIDNPPPAH